MNSKYLEKKYYPKGYDVMAIQFDGSPDCIDAIKKFCDNRFNDKDLSIKNYDYTVFLYKEWGLYNQISRQYLWGFV